MTDFTHKDIPDNKKRKYLIVIIYDVVCNKRRLKLSKFLKGYGHRVQNSAFECIATKKEYERIVAKTAKIINTSEDLLRIYKLFENNEVMVWGNVGFTEEEDDTIII
jgi:CRISPR-associated protein Cas2